MMQRDHAHLCATIVLALFLALPATAGASGDHEYGHDEQADETMSDTDHHGGENGHGHDDEDHHREDGHHHDNDGDHHGEDGHGHDHDRSMAFGEPADAADADRTITITAHDSMRFEPARIDIEAGQTVRFVVKNVGQQQHSFMLAAHAAQKAHEAEMESMSTDRMARHMDDEPNGVVVQPGETDSLTWHFTRGGPVEFACHIPGHYPAGMKGRINIRQ